LNAAALNVLEFRPIADLFDSSAIIVGAGTSGPDEYVLLARRDSDCKRLPHLRGKRVSMWTAPKMCVAQAWLATLLEEEHPGSAEEFFGTVIPSGKISAVVLPVFFKQTDACVASRRGFEMMCELNPQIARELSAIAISPLLTTCFYAFRKGFHGATRDRFTSLHSTLLSGLAGKQLATLFQFDDLTVRDTSCVASSLSLLDRADRVHTRLTAAGHKG
jgi:phosphonate transport system substrate-binding protein